MKLFENSCDFDYSWAHVTAANWKKYPNEVSTHVIAVDVLKREVERNGQVLITERLITCKQNVPQWIMMLLGGSNISYVREVSTVDLSQKSLVMRSCNLTYSNLLKVYETVTYTPHPEDPVNRTLFSQEAQITAYGAITRLCNKMEDWSVQRFRDNANKGKIGFDNVLKKFEAHWQQKEKLVDEISSSIISKVNETVEDIKLQTEGLIIETERQNKLLYNTHQELLSSKDDLVIYNDDNKSVNQEQFMQTKTHT
ncbi:hypothetical protein TPHA_0C02370 [Tetrapisispora phaffii CBS 4417]|uniref:PRELI/MSF1 domain-containing protein n=1 Tax=Tetrapisispora phaffii (strain ATCC 24235 / CBS 4417 / NBRC 1672 / NRRL Y-8282 / UCD 70-5) TaxID=1071381 RepID=G8BRL4_TETPH|nr:hypothetical protein TPHA_0C02370 [Tetrapisispora phaffii CBS 4417]CCE62390.1 hypothetical protein TPHA_0C02370 [Tetrapisispora phaffii CBS 4417]